ncbi:MAG: esterase-like activity of phytase family protein [Pseudomonadota bacterium]
MACCAWGRRASPLQDPADESRLFAPDGLDPEGIAYDPQTETLFWAMERRGGTSSPVFVHTATLDGQFLREIPVDDKYDHRIEQGADGELPLSIFPVRDSRA